VEMCVTYVFFVSVMYECGDGKGGIMIGLYINVRRGILSQLNVQ
jgi:hypothetical protein